MSDFIQAPRPPREPNEAAKLFGYALMTVGLLIATLCGLCSLAVGGSMLVAQLTTIHDAQTAGAGLQAAFGMLMLILVFGGLPFGVGVGLFFAGRALRRGSGPPR